MVHRAVEMMMEMMEMRICTVEVKQRTIRLLDALISCGKLVSFFVVEGNWDGAIKIHSLRNESNGS